MSYTTYVCPAGSEQSKYIKKKCGRGGEGLKYEAYYWLFCCWPLDLMTKLEGAPYRADYSRKKGSLSSAVPHWAPSHILHFQTSITTCIMCTYTLAQTQTQIHTNTHTHTGTDARAHTHTNTTQISAVCELYSLKVFLCLDKALGGFEA